MDTKGVHITLFQSREFKNLPVDIATKLVAKLNEYLVSNPNGELLMYFLDVKPYADNEQYLFWNVDRTKKNQRLMTAHGMSLALSIWVEPKIEDNYVLYQRMAEMSMKRKAREHELSSNAGIFGSAPVGEEYPPHITIAANSNGFKGFKPLKESLICSARRVVLARMGAWGKIDKILI